MNPDTIGNHHNVIVTILGVDRIVMGQMIFATFWMIVGFVWSKKQVSQMKGIHGTKSTETGKTSKNDGYCFVRVSVRTADSDTT